MGRTSDGTGRSFVIAVIAIAVFVALAGAVWYMTQANNMSSKEVASKQNTEQAEPLQEVEAEQPIQNRTGTFVGVPPKSGSGSVTLLQGENGAPVVRLEDDFNVQEGPDLFVGFGNDGTLDHDTLFAQLESFEGRQEYQVPDTIDVSTYNQVFIYCKEFSVDFAVATLE